MRPIKFKAWNKKEKLMVDLVKITPLALAIDPSLSGGKIGIYIPDHPDLEIIQFTGLTDKNGKEIYEGDICRVKYYNHSTPNYIVNQFISFEDGTFTLNSKNTDDSLLDNFRGKCPLFYCYAPNTIEVIGNIYEHPEFLK